VRAVDAAPVGAAQRIRDDRPFWRGQCEDLLPAFADQDLVG
jgi:hypothetical protein